MAMALVGIGAKRFSSSAGAPLSSRVDWFLLQGQRRTKTNQDRSGLSR